MDTLGFLQRILPSEGYYCAFLADKKQNKFFQDVESLAHYVLTKSQQGYNVYHAIASFQDSTKRTQKNAHAVKVLALDVDCGEGKPYPTWKEGLQALGRFVDTHKFPKPMIVHSGNGLHVYWVLDKSLPPHEWKPLAERFKAFALASDLKSDPAVPADSARVLRPTDTTNPKGGRQVKLLIDAPPTTVAAIQNVLPVEKPPVVPATRRTSKLLDNLAVESDLPPAVPEVLLTKCQQIREMVRDRATLSEPEWYALMGIAAFCENPEHTARAWSKGHPDYDPQKATAKMHQWREKASGGTWCNTFENLRPDGCKSCQYKDTINSPVRLGAQYAAVEITETLDPVGKEVPVPFPFKHTKKGMVITLDDVDTEVCPFTIYPVGYGKDESLGYEVVRYHWKREHVGWQELKFRQALLADDSREFPAAIADQGIVLNNKKQTRQFQYMLRTYMHELRKMRGMTNIYTTMGWKEDNTQFLLGSVLLRKNADGSVTEEPIALANTTERVGADMFTSAGSLEEASKLTGLIDVMDAPYHGMAMLLGLSAPLWRFTGLKGLTVSLYGPTGGGKSLIQLWIQSFFGNPDKLHFTAKFTTNALFSRLGTFCNLAVTVDETTLMDEKELGEMAYWVTQGRDKARLDRTSTEREPKTWETVAMLSTNRSLTSTLISGGMDTTAQLARVLEIDIPQHPVLKSGSDTGRKLYHAIHANYGLAGRVLMKELVRLGPEGIKERIELSRRNFLKNYGVDISKFAGEERYWETAFVLADVIGQVGTELNILRFDYKRAVLYQLRGMSMTRRNMKDIKKNAFDLLAEYLTEYSNVAVTVMYTQPDLTPILDHNRIPRDGIRIRFELFKPDRASPPDKGVVMIDRAHLRKWLSIEGGDYKEFIRDLEAYNALAYEEGKRMYLAKNTPLKANQIRTLGLNLAIPELQTMLTDKEKDIESIVYGKLQLL